MRVSQYLADNWWQLLSWIDNNLDSDTNHTNIYIGSNVPVTELGWEHVIKNVRLITRLYGEYASISDACRYKT